MRSFLQFGCALVGLIGACCASLVAEAGEVSCSGAPAPVAAAGAESRAAALKLLGSVTQLQAPQGRAVLFSNLERTLAINAVATPLQRAQALRDAYITNDNANQLADGLGARLGEAYRSAAYTRSDDDGATMRCGQAAPSVGVLIGAVNATSRRDATAAKNAFADPHAGLFTLPQEGVFDVFGAAYQKPRGPGADEPAGNARPFLIRPVVTYPGEDFFGVATDSRSMLWGPSAADKAAGRTGSSLVKSPAFPSGHTTYGFSEALTLALMVPERYAALAYRASEYGDSRIVLGAHHALDVIGGRTLATYDLAQDLAGAPSYAAVNGMTFRTALANAAHDLRNFLRTTCPSLDACAAADPIVRAGEAHVFERGSWRSATPREAYAFRLNYALDPIGRTDLPPAPVPPEAARLLETRFPYLSDTQRLAILRSTEGASGHFLDASPLDGAPLSAQKNVPPSGVYARLDLFAAAQGYATFDEDVVVEQDERRLTDPLLREFADLARSDRWSNDIGGRGGLTKRGPGTLTLGGRDTFAGASRVEGGTLRIEGSVVAPIEVREGATLWLEGAAGDIVLDAGATLTTAHGGTATKLAIGRGAHLTLRLPAPVLPGARTLVVSAPKIEGQFADVGVVPPVAGARLVYTPTAIYLASDQKRAAREVAR